jgi:hypothetical protein
MMFKINKKGRFLIIAGLLASITSPLLAQSEPPQSSSTNAMVNLIRLLVQQGTITQANGDALLAQAEADAGKARATSGELPPAAPGTIRVPYVPETVRNQIRDEIKAEVMKQAAFEGWAVPDKAAPDWVSKVRLSADIRVRSQSDLFSQDNANDIIDYGAINATSGGFDFFNNINNVPLINARQDRINRMRIRARLGLEFDVSKFAEIGVRVATGDDNSPISTNQILGGGLSKRNIWLDQAYLELKPTEWVSATYGRFANPFASTDLLFDRDLNFDGFVAEATGSSFLPEGMALAARAGAFPLDFGSGDFPSTSLDKRKYPAKWMFAGQIEGSYDFGDGIQFNAAAAYYHFRNVQGQLSEPCLFNGETVSIGTNDPVECSSDGTRAFFPRKGNTLFFIRNIVVPAPDTSPASNRQYLGLAYRYSILDLNASISVPLGDIRATLRGNYLRNLAFKRGDQCRYGASQNGIPITNVLDNNGNSNPCPATNPARVVSGNQGYLGRLTVGYPKPSKWGEWSVTGDYRYLQSDAVLDSLTDSDFHLGGTNTKGYTIAGTLGLFDGVSLTGRWMSANEITGRPLSIDVFQLDLSAEF